MGDLFLKGMKLLFVHRSTGKPPSYWDRPNLQQEADLGTPQHLGIVRAP
jgi:hypothetical protein